MTTQSSSDSRLRTHRVMGIEHEFGVAYSDAHLRAQAGVNSSISLSHVAVAAYALLDPEENARGHRVRWDYGDESPLRDARGFEMQRASAHPTQLTDEVDDAFVASVELDAPLYAPDIDPEASPEEVLEWAQRRSIGNAVLTNGARLYVDHAHPEYSSPEVATAREALLYDRAGEMIAERSMGIIADIDTAEDFTLYKNNTDGKGASYGTHENFLMRREVPWDRVVEVLLPFFASRHILVGAGRVGLGRRGQEAGLQTSSRADFFEEEVGLETTINRPIVNTRDEPHADASRYRRLHVIIGDANMLEVPTFLKMGMTSLVLAALELEVTRGEALLPTVQLTDPVAAFHAYSHDLSLSHAAPTTDGGTITALQIQHQFLDAIVPLADHSDAETRQILQLWREILTSLAQDPMVVADRVEWAAKLKLMTAYRARHGLAWDDARLKAIDLQFTDLRASHSLYRKLAASGAVTRLVTDDEVRRAVTTPPSSTRAYLRGQLISHHRASVQSAGWDVVMIQQDDGSGARLRFSDPEVGSQHWCEKHGIDARGEIPAFLDALARAQETSDPAA